MFSSKSLLLSSPVQNSPSPLLLPPISDHHDPSHDVPSRSKTRPRAGPTHQIRTRPGAQDLHQQHEMDQEKWLAIPGMKRITPTTDLEDSRTTPTTGLEDSRTTPTTGLEDLINEVFTNPSKHNSQGSQQHSKVQQQIHENALRQQHRRKEKSFGAHQLVELVHQELEDHAEPQIGLPSRFLQKEFYMEINGDDDLDEGDIKKIDGLDLHTVKDIVENNLWRWDADEGHEQIFEKHKKDCSQAHIDDSNADQPVHKDAPHGHQPVHMAAPHGHMVAPHEHMAAPHGHMVAPHGHMVAPHGDMVAPHGHMVTPHGDMVAPHRHMVAPHGDMVAPHGHMVAPHGHMVAPHGDMAAPHLDKSVVKNLAVVSATHQHEESLNPEPLNTRGGREEKMKRIPEVSGVRSLQPSPPRQVKESEHFNCIGRAARLYADVEAGCKRFLLCHESGRMGRFNCPVGTLFNEPLQICDWKYKVTC
ncbi:uncharacterized protein LOC111697000 isoform X2 [Eurytemora carolleeae]|uniref:uncharacterized protein LOC111697000 isoform X2 n=1 Tax=Eurytemora carolleeae TaxID=1294199 RepID=UPI000C77B144|nr:uncharacterized protein LOC111697000 isoform X2 [Eurytemora carolleeae]|eukprot:XP_023322621.1 uncharacterized protein LOC111697000 isoform X2 [Eurytemora affinis]